MPRSRARAPAVVAGRRQRRKQLTRSGLLAAGRRLFAERGLYEARIEDLTRQAGVAKGTLYGYFANKEDLIEAVVAAGTGELLGEVHREAQGAADHGEALASLARAHLEFFEENPDLLRILHQVRGLLQFERPEARRLRRVLRDYLAGLAHVLALRPATGARGGNQTGDAAELLFGAVSGIASLRASLAEPLGGDPRSAATVQALVALVLAYEKRRRAARPGRAGRRRRAATRRS